MNRRTNKKLKAQINNLKGELFAAQLQAAMGNLWRITPDPFMVKAVVHMREFLYPEQAYAILRKAILQQLEANIDDFIETYRDDISDNYVAYFKFIPTFRKENK